MAGGEPGRVGRQWLIRANGEHVELAGIASVDVSTGDRLVIETPGRRWGGVS